MGYTGDCADLPEQFAEFLPEDYTCSQFPGELRGRARKREKREIDPEANLG